MSAEKRVSEVMQTDVTTLSADDQLDFADDVMNLGRVRHLPVLNGKQLVGIVSNRDLLAASLSKSLDFDPQRRREFLRSIDIAEVMTREIVCVEPDATLREAASMMIQRRVGCLPVVEPDQTLIGLVTETDLLREAFGF
jgi:acetoin utilization protein AcuB